MCCGSNIENLISSMIQLLQVKCVLPIKIHHQLIEVHGDGLMGMQHDQKWCSDFENGQMDIRADGCVVGTGQVSTSGADVNVARVQN